MGSEKRIISASDKLPNSTIFYVKGASNYSWGMKDRLSRIFNPKTGRAVMLAFDMGLSWVRLQVWNVST